MRKTFLLIVSLVFVTSIYAQQPARNMYVVQFNDKGVNSDASINPSQYLTDKAIERRLKQKIAFDLSDIPVNEQYVKSIAETGAKILTRSRWLNTIVIETTPEIFDNISKLAFVSKSRQIDIALDDMPPSPATKPYFANENISAWTQTITKNATADVYSYGAAFNQIDQMKGQFLHNNGFSGQGMTIAVLDAGFNSTNIMNCFDSLRANNQIKGTRDFHQPGNNVYATSMHTHGTSVLSCMGAYLNGQMVGTAPKADYWLIRTEVGEFERIIEEYYWVSGAEFADSIGADLINSSLGYTEFDDPATNHTYADMDGNTTVVTIGADMAAKKGILVVNSAGNSGGDAWRYIGAPADGDSVFTIGAVDAFGNRAGFSSVGPTYDGRIKPTVSAQGSGSAIYYPGGLAYGSGTSFSSPITCGITACLWQAVPAYSNMQIIELIKATASQANQPDSLLGWGIPNYQSAASSMSVQNKPVDRVIVSYPNPVANKLTLGFPAPVTGKFSLEIINMQGQLVYSFSGNENGMQSLQLNDIGYLPSGIYITRLSSGTAAYTGKIIKK